MRFNLDGTLDLSFNQSGAVVILSAQSRGDDIAGLAIQGDGKIVVAATSQFAASAGTTSAGISIYRYDTNGAPDGAFGVDGRTDIDGK